MNQIEITLKEIKEQITEFRTHYLSNEQAVRAQLIEPILISLGWKTSNPKYVRHNAPSDDGKIPDYRLLKDAKNILIVEAKNLSIELTDSKVITQLSGYCYNQGVGFGILTNGVCWLLFNTFQKNPQDRIVWQVDLEKESIATISRKLSSFSYENIDELETLITTSKELEENWKSLITSVDSITTIISQRFIDKLKSSNPHIKIDQNKIRTFTESKLSELFEITIIDDEKVTKKPEIKINETKFSEVEDNIFRNNKEKKAREKISVTFPDKTIFNHKNVTDTFLKTIQKIGIVRVKSLGIIASLPLISESKDNSGSYVQHKVEGYWIMTNISTNEKFNVLLKINERLDLKLLIKKNIPEV